MYIPISQRIQKRLQSIITNISQDFDIVSLSKSPARFNPKKLDWFNEQYLRALTLEEFVWRATQWKIQYAQTKSQNQNYRLGNYAYLVDFDKQKMFVSNFSNKKMPTDGGFYPLGGGQDLNETQQEGLIREMTEETMGKLKFDFEKFIFVMNLKWLNKFTYVDGQKFAGKDMNLFVYPTKQKELEAYVFVDGDEEFDSNWFDITEVLQNAKYFNYAIWREFCLIHDLPLVAPNSKIRKQYLAYLLDKHRITTLDEFGVESDCILNYNRPDKNILQWKKITLKESLENLAHISQYIKQTHIELQSLQQELYMSIFTDQVEVKFAELVNLWETKIKTWLDTNQKNYGAYLWPLRVALSGQDKSPSPFELLAILDTGEVSTRLDNLL